MTTADPEIGSALQAAASAIERWSTRPDSRRRLVGGAQPLSATERWLLAKVATSGPVRMSTLAEWQRVDRSTMTTQIRGLENAGYVVRSPDPADGRASLVSLSAAGATRYRKVNAAAAQMFNELVEDWPAEERRRFAHLLTKFARTLDEPPSTT